MEVSEQAASLALSVGKTAYHALKLLELSRGIIIGFAIDCRSDLSDLKDINPRLFNKFNDLRIEIDSPLPQNQCRSLALKAREKAICDMEEIITEIRRLPGYEGFQLPPSPNNLMSMARDGPIVTIISTYSRSDAIIVTSSNISSIALPKLLYREVQDRLTKIAELTKAQKLRRYRLNNKEMLNHLSWLWDVAVEPVIQALQLTVKPESDADLDHIWWIGV